MPRELVVVSMIFCFETKLQELSGPGADRYQVVQGLRSLKLNGVFFRVLGVKLGDAGHDLAAAVSTVR